MGRGRLGRSVTSSDAIVAQSCASGEDALQILLYILAFKSEDCETPVFQNAIPFLIVHNPFEVNRA